MFVLIVLVKIHLLRCASSFFVWISCMRQHSTCYDDFKGLLFSRRGRKCEEKVENAQKKHTLKLFLIANCQPQCTNFRYWSCNLRKKRKKKNKKNLGSVIRGNVQPPHSTQNAKRNRKQKEDLNIKPCFIRFSDDWANISLFILSFFFRSPFPNGAPHNVKCIAIVLELIFIATVAISSHLNNIISII